jgi:cytochrome P450
MIAMQQDNATIADRAAVPSHVPPERVIDFDYLRDPALQLDPHGRMLELQSLPYEILWTTGNGGHWVVTRHEAVLEILQRPELFSSAHVNIPPMQRSLRMNPEELDPPEHGKFRALLNPIMSPTLVGNLAENARQVARTLIDAIQPLGAADVMQTVTVPMPCSIFMKLIGLPPERLSEFLHYKDQFLFADDPDEKRRGVDSIAREMSALAALRRKEPSDDMMTVLVNAEVDGRPLTEHELLEMGFLLFLAGLDTVTSAMTSCFAYLAQNPTDRQRLIDDPSLIREAIEEILRRYSVVNPVRTATSDFNYRGLQIKAKDQFLISTILANLDDRAFDDPTSVLIERDPNPHLTFGGGPHRCAGSHLARIELRVLLEEALPRLKNLRLQEGAHLHWHAANLVGLSALPLQWDVD